jgi:transcription elongation GreA/GreB family factor
LQSRVKDLELELINLKKAYQELLFAIEFIDIIEDVDYSALIEETAALDRRAAETEARVGAAQKPYFDYIKSRIIYIEAQLKTDMGTYAKLIDTMDNNEGTIRVVLDIIFTAIRAKCFKDEVNMASSGLGLIP